MYKLNLQQALANISDILHINVITKVEGIRSGSIDELKELSTKDIISRFLTLNNYSVEYAYLLEQIIAKLSINKSPSNDPVLLEETIQLLEEFNTNIHHQKVI